MKIKIALLALLSLISSCALISKERTPAESPYIVNGQEVTDASIKEAVVAIGPLTKCTGTYIGHNKVITAAHCISANSDILPPQVSFQSRKGIFTCSVTSIKTPDDLDLNQWKSDIAIFKIKCDPEKLKHIQPFVLHQGNENLLGPIYTAGYGCTGKSDTSCSHFPNLNYVQLEKPTSAREILSGVPNYSQKAQDTMRILNLARENRHLFFKIKDNKTFSSGDSGGPTFTKSALGENVLVGVNVIGIELLPNDNYKAYYASSIRIQSYLSWIVLN